MPNTDTHILSNADIKYVKDMLHLYEVEVTDAEAAQLLILFKETDRGKSLTYELYLYKRCVQVYEILAGKSKSSYNTRVLEILNKEPKDVS